MFERDEEAYQTLYEGKLTGIHDHRAGTFDGVSSDTAEKGNEREVLEQEKRDAYTRVIPRYWVAAAEVVSAFKDDPGGSWLTFHNIANPNNERTFIATLIPTVAVGNSLGILVFDARIDSKHKAMLCANFNALVFDYISRLKISNRNFNFFVVRQLPILPLDYFDNPLTIDSEVISAVSWCLPRLLELSFSSWDLELFAQDSGWDGPPFRWDDERRFLIRCELDAAFFHLYLSGDKNGDWRPARKADGCPYDETPEQLEELKRHFPTPRDTVNYIMDTFPIVRRKDEEAHGEYRTKRVILEIYDAMQEAIRTGQPYETRLDPPPGPPMDADGNFVSYADIADHPPPHIHLPRDAVLGGDVLLQMSDLGAHFPKVPFRLRLNAAADAQEHHVRPAPTSTLGPTDTVVLASPRLQRQGVSAPVAIGRLRAESRTDAKDGSSYVLVSVRGDDGLTQARFSPEEWRQLTTIGVVENGTQDRV